MFLPLEKPFFIFPMHFLLLNECIFLGKVVLPLLPLKDETGTSCISHTFHACGNVILMWSLDFRNNNRNVAFAYTL